MNVEIIVRIEGREVAVVTQEVFGDAIEREEQTEQLKDRVGQAVLEEGFVELAGSLRRPCCCGQPMKNMGRRRVTIVSLSGEICLERTRFRCRQCGVWQTPADAVICCGNHRITRHLAKQICQLATLEHYTRLEQLMADQHRVHLGHDDMQQLVHDVGGHVDAIRQTQAVAQHSGVVTAEFHPSRIYVSCDGIMYCTNETEPDLQHPGRNRLIWKQMRVGCVYWQDVKEHWHKRVIWGQEDLSTFAASLYRLACRCGYREAAEKIYAADGGEWCWSIHEQYFGDAVGILDWYHASEHIWECARTVCTEAGRQQWVETALETLRAQGGEGLGAWLESAIKGLRNHKRDAVTGLRNYFRGRVGITDYASYRASGYQIGTGMIESTARQLVGLRLKGPGMHWSPAGASAVTALRAHNLNNNWHNLWKTLTIPKSTTTN